MKTIKAIISITIVILLASCAKENFSAIRGAEDLQEITITAYSSESERASDSTKATLDNGGTKVYWELGDEVMVFCGGVGSRFKSTNVSNSSTATFTGMIASTTNFIEGSSSQATLWGLYPFNDKATSDGNSVTTSVPSVQVSPAGSFDREAYVLLGKSSSLSMGFNAVCGGIRFSVSRNDISSVVFRGNRGEALAGKVNISFSGGVPSVSRVTDASDVIMVKAPNGGVFEKGRYYYAVMLPVTLSGGFTMTMYTVDGKEGSCVSTSSNTVKRSSFATIDNIDNYVTGWKESEQGGDMGSGIYLGVCGFNQALYPYPIQRLTADSQTGFNSFIDNLTSKDGTLLYYGVDNSLNTLQKGRYPSNLHGAIVVTFTDGLDEGSSFYKSMMEGISISDAEYLSALNTRLYGEKVRSLPISAYAIGLRGTDIEQSGSITQFRNNLKKLSNPESNWAEVTSMSEVNAKFQEIAKSLSEKNVSYNVSLTIPGQADGTRIRFTFDNVSSATSSALYIEGTFRLSDRTLTDITYKGFTSGTGTAVKGVVDGIFVSFTFDVACENDGAAVNRSYIKQWKYIASSSFWQKNSEFTPDENAEIRREKHSLAVMLLLDCSKSLGSDFSKMKSHAKSFISTLYNNSIDPNEAQSVSLNEKSATIAAGASIKLTATVSPSTAENKKVRWSTDNPSVATVDQSGNVTGISAGTATITVCTVDGGFTASCLVTVKEYPQGAVDMGLSVFWASCNLGAKSPEDYGDYYAWGETATKSDYSWSTYKWCKGSSSSLTKYYSGDKKVELELADDVAHVKLGGKWRMPTATEFEQLLSICTVKWTTMNGVYGRKFTSNKTGNSIFLPASGCRYGTSLSNAGSHGDYWSSSLNTDDPADAWSLCFGSSSVSTGSYGSRYYGQSVRPVTE